MAQQRIGTFVVNETLTHSRSFETAAWSETIEVAPGEYAITGEVNEAGGVKDFPGAMVALPGTVTQDYFQSLWCGSPIGRTYNRHQNSGKPATYHLSTYAHALAKGLLDGKCEQWRLDGFRAVPHPFEYNGEQCITYRIVRA